MLLLVMLSSYAILAYSVVVLVYKAVTLLLIALSFVIAMLTGGCWSWLIYADASEVVSVGILYAANNSA